MLARIENALKQECLLSREDLILVGVSGGPDSLCLMDAFSRLGFHCVIAHLDHGLRPESEAEAQEVRRLADTLDFQFVHDKADVRAVALAEKLSIEEAARNLRYRFLFAQASTWSAKAVAVGHTADDQVETVLMHLLRGAGLAGLKGMLYRTLPNPWSSQIPLVRPLLGTWREEVMKYHEEQNYSPLIDASNLDQSYFRNRLRHDLIPYIERYNPRARLSLHRTAEILREDYFILEKVVDDAWQACLVAQDFGYLIFSKDQIRSQPGGIQRYLVRRAIELLRPGFRDLDFVTLQRALEFIAFPTTQQIDLAAGLRLGVEQDRLFLARWEAELPSNDWPQLSAEMSCKLELSGEVPLGGGWLLKAMDDGLSLAGADEWKVNANPYQAMIDRQGLNFPLIVRNRRPGDRIAPLGMDGHTIKLTDFMVNVKLPKRARAGWPLVTGTRSTDGEEEILWIPGFRQSHSCRVTETTEQKCLLWMGKI